MSRAGHLLRVLTLLLERLDGRGLRRLRVEERLEVEQLRDAGGVSRKVRKEVCGREASRRARTERCGRWLACVCSCLSVYVLRIRPLQRGTVHAGKRGSPVSSRGTCVERARVVSLHDGSSHCSLAV